MSKVEIIKRPDDPRSAGEKLGSTIKKSAWMAFFESLLMVIFGILLVAWSDLVIKAIAYVVGGFLVIRGGYQIANYFAVKGRNDFFNNDLLWGIIITLLGAVILVKGEEIASAFRIVVGIWMIYEALVHMNTASKLNAAKVSSWRYSLIMALVMLLIGLFITFNTGAVAALVGWMMILCGMISLVGNVVFMQHVNAIIEKITK